jgi:ABC-type dipeptide/oligopeptide/nickel transport system ATPase component
VGVLDLLRRLTRERGITILLITHDLATARYLADRVVVLAGARVVEQGPTANIFAAPSHPYTRQLLEASRAARAAPPGMPTGEVAAARLFLGRRDAAGLDRYGPK